MNERDDLTRRPKPHDRTVETRTDGLDVSVDAMRSMPSGLAEPRATGRETHLRAGISAGVNEDVDLEHRVERGTGNALHRAGDALQSAAPTIGRGAEAVVGATGAALSAVGGVVGTVVGKIAGRLGGWWSSASEALTEMPDEERHACLVHFETYGLRPAGLTFESALPGYTVGYVASRNPDYRGRRFEEIEADLRHGFGTSGAADYDALRDFSRYGYERGARRP